MPRVSIYVPDDLHDRMNAMGEGINWSGVAQRAFNEAIIAASDKEFSLMNNIGIVPVFMVDDDIVVGVQRLHAQVSSSPVPTVSDLTDIVSNVTSPGTILFLARELTAPHAIKGMLTVVAFRIPSGMRVWIEDVVVDEDARGQGIGEALNRAAIAYARTVRARTIELTSRPSRVAANKLYAKLGFERRETNVHRLAL